MPIRYEYGSPFADIVGAFLANSQAAAPAQFEMGANQALQNQRFGQQIVAAPMDMALNVLQRQLMSPILMREEANLQNLRNQGRMDVLERQRSMADADYANFQSWIDEVTPTPEEATRLKLEAQARRFGANEDIARQALGLEPIGGGAGNMGITPAWMRSQFDANLAEIQGNYSEQLEKGQVTESDIAAMAQKRTYEDAARQRALVTGQPLPMYTQNLAPTPDPGRDLADDNGGGTGTDEGSGFWSGVGDVLGHAGSKIGSGLSWVGNKFAQATPGSLSYMGREFPQYAETQAATQAAVNNSQSPFQTPFIGPNTVDLNAQQAQPRMSYGDAQKILKKYIAAAEKGEVWGKYDLALVHAARDVIQKGR